MPTRSKFHGRLQRLSHDLIAVRFESAQNLWDLQIKLLDLQREIQAAISQAKGLRRSEQDHGELLELRDARWHSRHLGDALAWVLLKGDEQVIEALGHGPRVPVSEVGHGSTGMISSASGLSAHGWGFPLIHDITDCLRIGDITFIRPEDELRTVTVEIKTRLLDRIVNDDGTESHQYQSTVMTHSPIDGTTGKALDQASARTPLFLDPTSPVPRRRSHRQAIRMKEALVKATAGEGIVDGMAQPLLTLIGALSADSHWKTLRRLIRTARRDGIAGEVVDRGFLYLVSYSSAGQFDTSDLDRLDLSEHLLKSDFMASSVESERSIVVSEVPDKRGNAAYRHLPYYLWPIPQRAVFDILHGRISIIVMVNQGHICDRLRAEGLKVRLDPQKDGPGEIVILQTASDELGQKYQFESHQFPHAIQEVVAEFRSLDYLVQKTHLTLQGVQKHIDAITTRDPRPPRP